MEDASEMNMSRLQLIPASMLNVPLPAGIDLSNQHKTVKNDNVPLPIYIGIPLVTMAISACLIYGFCLWRLKFLRRRKEIMERQNKRRRRSSLKPGSSEKGKKFGLTRAIEPDGDPLIIPTVKLISLARKLNDLEHLMLDYRSYKTGDCIPEKYMYKVKEVAYDISINPLFNSLQSGACGYVLDGGDKTTMSPPSTKKSKETLDDDFDSDGSLKNRTSKSSVLNKGSTTTPSLLSRLSAKSKSKEDPLRCLLANKSIVQEIQDELIKEEKSTEESFDDASHVASSVESLNIESHSSGTSEEELDDHHESAKKLDHDTPKIPTTSRLSNTTSASDNMKRTSSTPKPLSPLAGPSKASVLAKVSSNPMAPNTTIFVENSRHQKSNAESGHESPTLSPRINASKFATFDQESTRATLSSKYLDKAYSSENKPSTSWRSKYLKALDDESRASLSPRSLTISSSSSRASSTPRTSKAIHSGVDSHSPKSGKESPRSSSAPRASKAIVSRRNAPHTTSTARTSKTVASGEGWFSNLYSRE